MPATLMPTWAMAAYLLPCVASVLATGVAWQGFRRLRQDAFREIALAFAVVAAVQALLLALVSTGWTIPGSLAGVLECISAAAMGWAFLRGTRRVFLVGVLTACSVLGAFVLSVWQMTGVETAWVTALWSLASAGMYATAAAAGWARHDEQPLTLLLALAMLALGSLAGAAGADGGMLALRLIAFPLVPVGLMQRATRDLQGAQRELQSFSECSLRQTQQLLMLLHTSTELASHSNIDIIMRQAAEGVALGIGADSALIGLLNDTPERTLCIQALYPGPLPHHAAIQLSWQPAIASAIQLGQQISLGPSQRGVHALAALMGSPVGPAIVQPLICHELVLGVLVALNGRSGHAFTQDDQRALEAFGAQVAAAAENAFLYKQLDAQTRDLTKRLFVGQEEAGRQAAILASIADGVIVADAQNRIILANPAAARIMGISSEELAGQPFDALFGQVIPLNSGTVVDELDSPTEDTLRAVFQIGSHVVQSSLAPVQNPDGRHMGLVAVLRDISAERAAEQAKTEFVSTVSQELRTPLAAVKGYVDLLLAGTGGQVTGAQRKLVGAIRSGAEQIATIVNSVVLFSEVEQGTVEIHAQPVDVGDAITQVASLLRPRAEARSLSLRLDLAPNLPLAHADPDRTRQIIEQLLDNALRFTPQGGQVFVRTMPSWDGTNAEQPSAVAITVADTGVGLTWTDQERVFEQFYRAPNLMQASGGGFGIGLSIARALAQAQGGYLWAESPSATDTCAGHGCKFTLLLPAIPSQAALPEIAYPPPWIEDAVPCQDERD